MSRLMIDPVFIIVGVGLLCMTAIPILAWILIREGWARAAFKAEILRLLHESAPASLRITDEHFGTDQEAAIALDRDTGHFLLWQKKTNRVQGYPAEAITKIEFPRTGNDTKVQLRLELDDPNNSDVSLCFGQRSSRNPNVMCEAQGSGPRLEDLAGEESARRAGTGGRFNVFTGGDKGFATGPETR